MGYIAKVICLVFTLSSIFADDDFQEVRKRVIGGVPLTPGQAPYLVSLWNNFGDIWEGNYDYEHTCGGALIRQNWVLTAAHCFYGEGYNRETHWKVVAGPSTQEMDSSGNQIMKIKKIHIHPGFQYHTKKNMKNDIALLELSSYLLLNDNVDTIDIDSSPDCAVQGLRCHLHGWGEVAPGEGGSGLTEMVPMRGEVPLVGTDVCNAAFKKHLGGTRSYILDDNHLCAGFQQGGVDACYGDAGSPLVCGCGGRGRVVTGVVSEGKGCALPGLYGVYSRVAGFSEWINNLLPVN